jgi:hypothetical protein
MDSLVWPIRAPRAERRTRLGVARKRSGQEGQDGSSDPGGRDDCRIRVRRVRSGVLPGRPPRNGVPRRSRSHRHSATPGELVATAGFVIVSRFENETIDGEGVYNRTTTTQCRHPQVFGTHRVERYRIVLPEYAAPRWSGPS